MMTDDIPTNVDIAVVGAGLTGLMAATELAHQPALSGARIALVAPTPERADSRTTAMMMPTIERLKAVDVWERVAPKTAPLRTMRLADGSKRLLRAPLVDFEAAEMNEEAFGFNVPNADMTDALEHHLQENTQVVRIKQPVASCETAQEAVRLLLKEGAVIKCSMVVAADGRHSLLREWAGIETTTWSYPQVALVTNLTHTLPHKGISTEFHTETGPFTIVPLPPTRAAKHRSSLVWVVRPSDVQHLVEQDLETLGRMVEKKMQSMLGALDLEAPLQSYPLSGMTARRFAAKRIALVGEAVHVFPPIGAQGFNLSARDCVSLAQTLKLDDVEASLAAYDQARRADIVSRTASVDVMNRSLLTSFLPVQMARTAGLGLLSTFAPLRKLAMRNGMGTGWT